MKCLILAAGYATRLYPLTKNFPKPLLEVRGKTILDWLIGDIDRSGEVDQYIVISNHRFADHFRTWAGTTGLPVTVLDDGTESNETRLGAVRDIQFAIDELKLDDDLLVIAGDNLLDFSLTDYIAYFRKKGTTVVMRYREDSIEKLRKTGVAEVDGEDRILSMEEKPAEPKSPWCTPPFYIYRKEDIGLVAEGIRSGCGVDAPGSFIAWLCGRTPVHAWLMPGRRYDIGNLESYEQVKREYRGIAAGTLIRNGLVLLPDGDGWKTERADVLIRGNRIERIGTQIPEEGEVINAAGMLVMPGLINAHTHAYMTIHRNYADDLAFFDWLEKVQKVEDGMTEEDVYWTTMLAIIEMLRSGTTCFVDMTIKSAQEKTGPRSAAAGAAAESGIRAVISRGLAGTAESEESRMKYGQAVREMEMFRDESRLQFLHGPHAPYSCMADYLHKLTNSCRERGIGQTIHLSESQAEMEGIEKEHGTTPIRYAEREGVFDVPTIVAHAVYATDEDIRIMAEKGVSVAICPKSNMKLGNGFAPARKFLEAGVNVCIGTDGCGSNNSLNLFQEMNAAALVYKGAERKAQCVDAAEALRMATVNGAKAIGREGELGVIREGAIADLILVRMEEAQFVPENNVVSGLVYSATGSEVDTVMVDGKVLMKGRKMRTIDEGKVFGEVRKIVERLRMY